MHNILGITTASFIKTNSNISPILVNRKEYITIDFMNLAVVIALYYCRLALKTNGDSIIVGFLH